MSKTIYTQITALPENSWPRQFAERAVAAGMQLIPMRDIPERDFRLFANNQLRTEVHSGMICLPIEEFLRIARSTRTNAHQLEGVALAE
jgi:hypothetical protein